MAAGAATLLGPLPMVVPAVGVQAERVGLPPVVGPAAALVAAPPHSLPEHSLPENSHPEHSLLEHSLLEHSLPVAGPAAGVEVPPVPLPSAAVTLGVASEVVRLLLSPGVAPPADVEGALPAFWRILHPSSSLGSLGLSWRDLWP